MCGPVCAPGEWAVSLTCLIAWLRWLLAAAETTQRAGSEAGREAGSEAGSEAGREAASAGRE